MWRSKDKDEGERLEPTQCPVCRVVLGKRNKEIIFLAHCEECRATFTWRPEEVKPIVVMDKDIKKVLRYCNKDGCHCRS